MNRAEEIKQYLESNDGSSSLDLVDLFKADGITLDEKSVEHMLVPLVRKKEIVRQKFRKDRGVSARYYYGLPREGVRANVGSCTAGNVIVYKERCKECFYSSRGCQIYEHYDSIFKEQHTPRTSSF